MSAIPGLGWIAGIGFKAIAGKALGAAGSAAGGALKWLGSLDLIHMIALGLAIAAAYEFTLINGLEFKLIPFLGPRIHIHGLEGKLADAKADAAKLELTLGRTRQALATSQSNEATLRAEIGRQNSAIAGLATASAAQQQAGAKAQLAASSRASSAEAQADLLRQSARQPRPQGAPACKPSKALEDAWK